MILFTLCFILATQIWGFRARRNAQISVVSRRFGYGMLVLYLIYVAYFLYPSNFSWEISLPLQVCDLLIPISAIALINSNRQARSLQYFCAFTLAGQAILTPAGNQDPASFRFWLYWIIHAGIYSSALFDLTVKRYTPKISDLFQVLIINIIYAILIVPLNIAFNWNYGFLGNSKPNAPTVIDLLGPWPQRIFIILLIAITSQILMYLPWAVYQVCVGKKQGQN